jgi:hypothetical protein
MTKEMKNCSIAKNSTDTATLFHETETLQLFEILERFPVLIQKLIDAGGIHIHLDVSNSTIVGGFVFGNANKIINGNGNHAGYGHNTYGDNSGITGEMSVKM